MSGNIHPLPLTNYVAQITKSLLSNPIYTIDVEHWWLWEARGNDILNLIKYNFFRQEVELDRLTRKIILV